MPLKILENSVSASLSASLQFSFDFQQLLLLLWKHLCTIIFMIWFTAPWPLNNVFFDRIVRFCLLFSFPFQIAIASLTKQIILLTSDFKDLINFMWMLSIKWIEEFIDLWWLLVFYKSCKWLEILLIFQYFTFCFVFYWNVFSIMDNQIHRIIFYTFFTTWPHLVIFIEAL